jgi:Bacterial Ig-like domain
MAHTTRVEQKSRKVKKTQYSVTWGTANNRYVSHKGRIPRADKRGYPVGHGYGPEAVKTTVAGEVALPTNTHVPTSGATAVGLAANIIVTFSEKMNPNTVLITVTPAGGANMPGVTTRNSPTDTIFTFDPSGPLAASKVHTVSINGTDMNGNASTPMTYNFTTGAT